jgi:hypothetical protein
LTLAWRAMVGIGFIIFLFYSTLLNGGFTHATGRGKTLALALEDIFSLTNLMIAVISGLLGDFKYSARDQEVEDSTAHLHYCFAD